MKLTKVPFHLVQKGLTRQPLCEEAAPEWKIANQDLCEHWSLPQFHRQNVRHFILKTKRFIAMSTIKRRNHALTSMWLTWRHSTGSMMSLFKRVCRQKSGWKYDDATKVERDSLLFLLQRSTGCWAACGPSQEQLLSLVLDSRAGWFSWMTALFLYLCHSHNVYLSDLSRLRPPVNLFSKGPKVRDKRKKCLRLNWK